MLRTILTLTLLTSLTHGSESLIIHEWGTFTSLQDPQGRTIGGINTDEEPLPHFVHDLLPFFLRPHGDLAPVFVKISPRLAPNITMRLETPVVYVHVPPGAKLDPFTLSVSFTGGILSQFYPLAEPTVNGEPVSLRSQRLIPPISADTRSSLTWHGIKTGTQVDGPETTSPVWIAPRQIAAARLTVGNEHERYLFYRGLGQLDAPFIVSQKNDQLAVNVRKLTAPHQQTVTTIPDLWLVDIRPNHSVAFRHIAGQATPQINNTSSVFTEDAYSTTSLSALKKDMHSALVADGLFADEAHAMLATWEASYFQAPGMRLFFLLPRAWTDHYLPLTLSRPAQINRVMMGRIELMTKNHQVALARISKGPISRGDWWQAAQKKHIYKMDGKTIEYHPGGQELQIKLEIEQYNHGVLRANNIQVPDDYQAYLDLGRFRDAILMHQQRITSQDNIALFIKTYLHAPGQLQAAINPVATP